MFDSNRLGHIPDAWLQDGLSQFGLGELVATGSIPFGLFGQNLFVTTTRGEFVFRGAPHYEWQLPTEHYFANRIHRQTTVPVPWPYHLERESGALPWSWGYAIMPRLPGLLLADPDVHGQLSNRQLSSLAAAEGVMLARLHRATSPVAGSYDPGTNSIPPFEPGYIARTVDRAHASASQARANNAHDGADAAWLEDLLATCRDLPEPTHYTVVHEDFNRNNMTAIFDGDQAEITGVFDLMTCHYGDGLADLARQFSMFLEEPGGESLARTYVQAYLGLREPLGREDRQRSALYLIDERLLVWEYFHRPGHAGGSWKPGESLRRWLGGYLDTWCSIVETMAET